MSSPTLAFRPTATNTLSVSILFLALVLLFIKSTIDLLFFFSTLVTFESNYNLIPCLFLIYKN